MKKKSNEVAVRKSTVPQQESLPANPSPADMIRLAAQGKLDLVQLKEYLNMQKDWEANEARKAFFDAFSRAQEGIAAVVKTKTNNQTHSKYADLNDVLAAAKPVYTKEGFSMIFYEGETPIPEHVRVYADVLHKAGHKETYHYDVPLDGKGIQGNANMTRIHGKSSSVAYGRRYLSCMIWNIATKDDDGNAACKPVEAKSLVLIGNKELNFIRDNLVDMNAKESELVKYLGITKLEDLPLSMYPKAQAAIVAKRKEIKT